MTASIVNSFAGPSHNQIHNQKGAALVAFAVIALTLSSILILYQTFASDLQTQAKTLQVCRSLGLDAQNKAAANLNRLEELNSQVRSLRLQMIAAQAALAAATAALAAPAIEQATLQIQRIRMAQQILYGVQQGLILKTEVSWPKALVTARTNLKKDDGKMKSFQLPRLPVRGDRKTAEPSVYEPLNNYDRISKWQVSWTLNRESDGRKRDYLLGCGFALNWEGEKWETLMIQDKSLSKLLSFSL